MPTTLEQHALDHFRRGIDPLPPIGQPGSADWIAFGLLTAMHICRMVREQRLIAVQGGSSTKSDGSPVTRLEQTIETFTRRQLARFAPGAGFVAEETGGFLPATGFALALDPIDGTWSFLNGTETCSTSIAIYSNGRPIAGIVANPATGEIGYAESDGKARLLQLSLFGEGDTGIPLPFEPSAAAGRLVNFQPAKNDRAVSAALLENWAEGGFSFVRSPGGSPSWSLLEAAKGEFVYVNLWSRRHAEPYDLAAGVLLVRSAGGEVVDLDGNPVDVLRHEGPFVAAIDPEGRGRVLTLVRRICSSVEGV